MLGGKLSCSTMFRQANKKIGEVFVMNFQNGFMQAVSDYEDLKYVERKRKRYVCLWGKTTLIAILAFLGLGVANGRSGTED